MKKNRITMVMMLAILACSFVSLTFAEESAADDTAVEPATVSNVTTIASGEILDLEDTKFTSNGKYIIESGATLALPMALRVTSDKDDTTIIEMKTGSIITFLSLPISVLDSNMYIGLKGELSYDVAVDLSTTFSIVASVDISDKGIFGLMGLEITGGKDKELSIGLDSAGKGFDVSLNVPSLTYKGTIPNEMYSSESGNVEIAAMDLKLSANISGNKSGFTITGQNNGTSATLSATKITSKIVNDGNEMVSTIDSPAIGFNVSGNTTDSITVSLDMKVASGLSTSDTIFGDIESKIEDAEIKATVIINDITTNTEISIGGAGSDYATISIGSITATNGIKLDDVDSGFEGKISNIDLKFKMTANGSGPTSLVVEGNFEGICFNGYLPKSNFEYRINNLDLKNGNFRVVVNDSSMKDATVEVKIESFELDSDAEFSEGVKVSGRNLMLSYEKDKMVLSADRISAYIKCIAEQTNYINVEGSGITVDLSDEIISITESSATIGYPSGNNGKIVMKDMRSVKDVITGTISISDVRNDLSLGLELGAGAELNISNSFIHELEIANGAKVNGNVLLSIPDSKIVFADSSELSIDNDTEGIILTVTMKDSIFQSAVISLEDGYSRIPAFSGGVNYTVDSSGKTATLSQGYGDVIIKAEATKYTIRYNNAASQIALGESLEIGSAPAEVGYRFVGWFDGIVFSEGTYYSLTMPGDRTLTPVFEPFQKRYSSSGNIYILDIGSAERISLDNTELSRVLNEMGKKSLNQFEVRNPYGSIRVAYSDLESQDSVCFEIIPFIPQDDLISDTIGSSPAYEIRTSIDGCMPVCSMTYRLSEGQTISDITVGSINQYGRTGTVNSDIRDNGDGTATVTFTAPPADGNNLDGYYLTTYSNPAPQPSDDSDSGVSIAMIAGIAVGVIIVAAIVVLFMKKRSGGSI